MKALPLTLGFIALIILATLVFDRFVLHPVGRYVPVHADMILRMDTVTGRVDGWQGKAGWVELGK